MITCPYCGSELKLKLNQAECGYCEITLGPSSKYGMYAENGKRKQRIPEKIMLSSETARLPLPELEQIHIVDLVLCLKAARAERSQVFDLMSIFNRAEDVDEYKGFADETGKEYEYWTRRCWMIENLLINRIGYFPERINQLFLDSLMLKNEKSLNKNMTIRKKRPKKLCYSH